MTKLEISGEAVMIEIYVKELDGVYFGLAHVRGKIVATTVDSARERTLKNLRRSLPPSVNHQIVEKESDFAEKTILALEKAHRGVQEFKDFDLAAEYLPEPLYSVLKAAAAIPVGYVASYGSIAKASGTEPRVVGQIMASNPLYPIVPCHRVVGADFSLVGYGGGKSPQALKVKLARLSSECRGFGSAKEISVNGTVFKVYPTEHVIDKARKQRLTLSERRQRTLVSFGLNSLHGSI
ncbi:hypothetical protein A3K79_05260 [Candidatus Bathyarchaeota archaeon RBG_13_46_16b]|nr:MAG: hypothetical protein A3K79_05260 [Candidatus Bathyarchaeota archaeon RBG_13_46_16b]